MPSRPEIVATAIRAAAGEIMKRLAVASVAELVKAPSEGGTPVDTGWARANWLPSIGNPITVPAGSRAAVTAGPQASGVAEVASQKPEALIGKRVFIQNNVPYIQPLNFGHSKQAPSGFIQLAIGRALERVAKTKLVIAVRLPPPPESGK
jgi:hypothetical protein